MFNINKNCILELLLFNSPNIIFNLFNICLIVLLFQETNRTTDLEFVYDDTDIHANEIAELYSYTEQYELQLNLKVRFYFPSVRADCVIFLNKFQAFEDQMEWYKLRPWWQNLTRPQQRSVIYKLLNQLEVSNKQLRMKAARCILYLAQGCWAEVQSDKEQQDWTRTNVMLLYEAGIFPAFVELLNIEIE